MYKQGNARGTGEVRRGTSSIHFHCPVPRSSSQIGHGCLRFFFCLARFFLKKIASKPCPSFPWLFCFHQASKFTKDFLSLPNLAKLGKLRENCQFCKESLAAHCEIPPHIAQYPFEIVSQRGVSHPFALFSQGIAGSIAEIPLLRGGIAPPLHMFSKGETLRKGGGGIAPNWPFPLSSAPVVQSYWAWMLRTSLIQ